MQQLKLPGRRYEVGSDHQELGLGRSCGAQYSRVHQATGEIAARDLLLVRTVADHLGVRPDQWQAAGHHARVGLTAGDLRVKLAVGAARTGGVRP